MGQVIAFERGGPSPGAFGADLSPRGRGNGVRGPRRETLQPGEMFSNHAARTVDLSPVGRGRERSERVRGAAATVRAIALPCGEGLEAVAPAR